MRILTSKQEEFCTYSGIAGILITSATIIQHFYCYQVFAHPVPAIMLAFLVCNLSGFIAISRQLSFAPLLLIISTSLCLFNAAMSLAGPLFSLLAILHFVYAATITVVAYIDGLPQHLRARRMALLAEQDEWQGKI
ncbi:MAG: hypothetical protein EOO09_12560 [Chitinophagaceae bacterium]|nr:MAG: hypothetical protein EOO09_12560 [Chitinophagaceae bacterium]